MNLLFIRRAQQTIQELAEYIYNIILIIGIGCLISAFFLLLTCYTLCSDIGYIHYCMMSVYIGIFGMVYVLFKYESIVVCLLSICGYVAVTIVGMELVG